MKLSAVRNAIRVMAVVAVLVSVSCNRNRKGGGDEAGKIVKLAFVTNNPSQFWKIATAGIRQYERESHVQVDIKMPPNGTPEDQNQILENLAAQGYDAISVSVIAPGDQAGVLNKVAARTNLITFDSDAPATNRLLYIGTNNFDAGKMLGESIVRLLPRGGHIAVFVGTFSADNASQRLKGIEQAIQGHHIDIIEKREDNTDRAKARSNVEDIINAHPDLNMAVGLWNYNGPQIAAAIDALGKRGKVLGAAFDEDEGTLNAIASGTIQCTVVQKPYSFGYLSSKWMHELAVHGPAAKASIPPSKIIDTGVEVIEKTNVASFQQKLAELTR